MDHLRLLYKANGSVLSSRNLQRKTANEIRAAKRRELYSSARDMPLSPRQGADGQKENSEQPNETEPADPWVATSSKISEKQSRQKAFITRFMAWKAEKAKQAEMKEKNNKRAPFVVPTGGGGAAAVYRRNAAVKKSFAPIGHVFKPPANVKDLVIEVTGENSVRCFNGEQQVTYQFVATPKKKPNVGAVKSSFASAIPTLRSKPTVHKIPRAVQNPAIITTEPKTKLPSSGNKKTTAAAPKEPPTATGKPKVPPFPQSSQKSTIKREIKSSKTPLRPAQVQSAPKPLEKPPTSTYLRSKMPPPSQQVPKINRRAPMQAAGTTSKLKSGLPSLKRPAFKAAKKSNSSISNAVLAIARSKALAAPPALKLNGKSLLQSVAETAKLTEAISETPTDLNPVNSYLNFVTSTKRKSSPNSNADLIFAELGNTISPVDDCCPTSSAQKSKENSDKKFHFVRYSVVQSDKEEEMAAKASDAPCKDTPEKTVVPPTTYMSPYVSVSRGKVSTRIEKEKRNSIYMAAGISTTVSPEKTAAMRHTLATVRYYRKQLMDEIARLDDRCASWEQYKEANAQLVEDSRVDMINVTIGQTKLLITKKLKQFGGLIDRCEDGVLGKNATAGGGDGEGAKPILPEDLEGFWSMVGLQIENVDKRFAELDRWKANNWTDPDEVAVKKPAGSQANIRRTKKRNPVTTAARPNGALQKMLKTAQAAYLNKKAVRGADEDVILTPSKSRQILIRDRRSRSAAATVITVNTPRKSRKSSAFEVHPSTDLNETPKLLPHIHGFRKSMNLLKNTLMNEQERKSPASPVRNPAIFGKSILKTPGSKSRSKSVIFNSPTLKFTIEDTVDDGTAVSNEEQEEDQRTYKLRNRRIILRDSAEFVIPK